MLANNICDMKEDIEEKRYTLPNYIGKKNSFFVFVSLYFLSFLSLIIISIINLMPLISLIGVLTIIPVIKNINIFYKNQTKKDTFSLSVKNFLIISGNQAVFLIILVLINYIFKIKI